MRRLALTRGFPSCVAPGSRHRLVVEVVDDLGVAAEDGGAVTVRVTTTEHGGNDDDECNLQNNNKITETAATAAASPPAFTVEAVNAAPPAAAAGAIADGVVDGDGRCTFLVRVASNTRAAVGTCALTLTFEASTIDATTSSESSELVLPLSVGPITVTAEAAGSTAGSTSAALCYRSLPVLPRGRGCLRPPPPHTLSPCCLVLNEPPPESATIACSTWDCGVLLGAHLAAAVNAYATAAGKQLQTSAEEGGKAAAGSGAAGGGDGEGRRLCAAFGLGVGAAVGTSKGGDVTGAGVIGGRGDLSPPPLRVIELGCGGGPSGLGLAAAVAALSAAGDGEGGREGSSGRGGGSCGGGGGGSLRTWGGIEVVLTDRDPAAVQLARANIASNRRVLQPAGFPPPHRSSSSSSSSSSVTVTAAAFDWDDVAGARALLKGGGGGGVGGGGGGRVAAILAADVVYHEDSFAPLVGVLVELTSGAAAAAAEAVGATTAEAVLGAAAGATFGSGLRSGVATVPLVYLAYRQRCESETAAHFFHMLDASFERTRVPWMWPSSGPPPRDATLYSLTPCARNQPSSSSSSSSPPCGYCDMLWEARARRLTARK